ncbi:MAG: ATP-binding protein [Thermodesulfobacteriota bacterium]
MPSLRVLLVAMNCIVLGLLFPSLSLLYMHKESTFRDQELERSISQLRQDLRDRGAALSGSVAMAAGQALAGFDYAFLNLLLRQVAEGDDQVVYCILMRADGMAVGHSDPGLVGRFLDDPLARPAAAITAKGPPEGGPGFVRPRFLEGMVAVGDHLQPVLEAVIPVWSGALPAGVLRCGFSLASINREIAAERAEWAAKMRDLRNSFLVLTAVFTSLGVLVAFFCTRYLLRGVAVLAEGSRLVAGGDLAQELPVAGLGCAEYARLARAFNHMTGQLRHSYAALDEANRQLEARVVERTRELAEAQEHLLHQAHEAGMAEMAVGVVHNIGNAMTPAIIAVSGLLRRLRGAPLAERVAQAASELAVAIRGGADLPPAERQRLLDILELLPGTVAEALGQVIVDLERINERQRHIEAIIALQLRYARLIGEREPVDLARLAVDSLTMLEESLARRQVRVETRLAATPPVGMEQAKLMQIVVNLIKNAYEAMDPVPPADRCLTVTTGVESGPPAQVFLAVSDTGVGFTAEERSRLFRFGYSTKPRGSGFGLHSSANYLIANHGSLTAESPGRGQGASFVIRLPLADGLAT